MNLEELKKNVRAGGAVSPLAVNECIKKLGSSKLSSMTGDARAVVRLAIKHAHQKNGLFDFLKPDEREEMLRSIVNDLTLNDTINLIATICGGNFLRPYLKYLNIGAEKFRDYSWPADVQHREKEITEIFDDIPDKDEMPPDYPEPDYFTEYEEEQVVYCENFAQPGRSGWDFRPTYFEAPAAPISNTEPPRKEPLVTALEYDPTFIDLRGMLSRLVDIVLL